MAFPEARIDVLVTPSSIPLLDLIGHDLLPVQFPKHLFDEVGSLMKPTALHIAARLALTLRSAHYDRVVILHHLTTAFGARKFAALARATGCHYVAGLDNGRGSFLSHPVVDRGFGQQHEATYMRDVAVAAGGIAVEDIPVINASRTHGLMLALQEPYAAIFPATGPFSRAREWPADRFGAIASYLRQRGIVPVVVGGPDADNASASICEAEPSTIDLTSRTPLPELAYVLSHACVVIGGDSFIGHLAAAVGTPVVSIFGPSNSEAWRPAGSLDAWDHRAVNGGSIVVRQDLPCQPCVYTGYRLGRPAGCPDRTCLKRVTTADVESAVSRVLGAA